mmetsp:Transcript_59118/g.139127  ORF Transcript_59118/g.139127 Transcript_59118/m.139127 type:complete len:209 (-) Transcript_59118:246-872(-)|eukprot:CAMPEP_0175827756 /NCGR_PEP_ID=MMETSP0107_2-20121207/12449_1 /TAXON_ID=195067 ORGANISM="Goniomonas pacifica, Strain CCMP1869" /NCGR_SAMPLE_ID=MMETSP0107_2 /ASSEMBLY_ACC=CAM_ASM_000203 /LENGTH=208 /DNA_ID=CAMNT_0017140445 /DNA_START=42 /DNA_END=668 /DNA_ORIENTATION=-
MDSFTVNEVLLQSQIRQAERAKNRPVGLARKPRPVKSYRVANGVAGKKSKAAIQRDTPKERDTFLPEFRGIDREAEKSRLAAKFAFSGGSGPIGTPALDEDSLRRVVSNLGRRPMSATSRSSERPMSATPRASTSRPKNTSLSAQFDQVAAEIEERQSFLEDMTRAGRGREVEGVIKGEIARLLKELQRLDNLLAAETRTSGTPMQNN